MAKSRRQLVRNRAGRCCEYCHLPEQADIQPFQVDHIRAQKHSGADSLQNMAWSCLPCNSYKGPNVAGYDPETDRLSALFDPRRDDWSEHFAWDGPRLVGLTPVGRATIAVLRMNLAERVEHRRLLMAAGDFAGDE
ncbi:MAG TPA: HNH endonuclease signature motif containing protein [Planctomycetaceae bacterium]|nr:HNH endonuclease signature motif containing protein [Planctomycetaceae bacterium]